MRIGLDLVDTLRDVHAAGYVYNDLKPDNILIGDASGTSSSQHKLRLIDFGFAARFRRKDGTRKP